MSSSKVGSAMIPLKRQSIDQDFAVPKRSPLDMSGQIDQGLSKEETVVAESATSDVHDDDVLGEHHSDTSGGVSVEMHQAQWHFYKELESELLKDTLLASNDDEVGNTELGKLVASTSISDMSKTVTPNDTLRYQSSFGKRLKFEKALRDHFEYRVEEKFKAKAKKAILKEQERIRASKKKLGTAKKRARGARKKMDLATKHSDIADFDLVMASEEVKEAEEQMQILKKHQPYRPTEEGFRKYKAKALAIELSSDASN